MLDVPPETGRNTVAIAGADVCYLDAGTGPPLLLAHGLGHSSTAWRRTISAFASSHRALAPDFPGHGRSASPNEPYDPPYFGRFVLEFIAQRKLGRVDAVGSSLGGLALLLAALEKPEAFRKLVLADPVGFTKPPVPPLGDAVLAIFGLWLSFPRTRALIRAGYAASFYDSSSVDEASVTEIVERRVSEPRLRAARCTLRELFHFSKHLEALHARLAHLKPPVLVIWGKNDPVLPVKDAEVARRVLPAARIELLDQCGHLPHIERPVAFNALALEFLNAA